MNGIIRHERLAGAPEFEAKIKALYIELGASLGQEDRHQR
jgi:hypothetical protein